MRNLIHSVPVNLLLSSQRRVFGCAVILSVLLGVFTAGCQTESSVVASGSPETPQINSEHRSAEALTLREGDVVKVAFPGAPNLDTVQPIRRDGRIGLPIIGEIQASGFTPAELSAELLKQYAPQLVYKEVSVTVVASSFSVFVSGAVLHPGKIVSDHPLTALEAIMEAGGFDSAKANLREVVIIRQGRALPEKLDLKRILEGKKVEPFYLKPADIVHVPDRLVLF